MVIRNIRADEGRALLEALDALRHGAHGSAGMTVRILAAADHDGVCAARILVTLLQRAGVKHSVVPVTGNTEIIEHLQQLEEDAEVRSLVLLNCGASLDLQRQLEDCDAPVGLRCYVLDAHRPFVLANLSARHERVVVLDDDPIAEATGVHPPIDAVDGGASATEDGDSDGQGESDAEKENVWDPDAPAGQKPPGQVAAERLSRKRRREVERQSRADQKRQRINEYYLTSYCATPVAMSLFKLARQVAPPSQDLLWLAAVSLAGYHDQGRISEVDYNRLSWEELKETLDRSSYFDSHSSSATQASGSVPGTAGGTASDDEDGTGSRRGRRRPPRAAHSQRQQLRFENDLRLTLYKHWTLEDAIMHSSYFYGTLELQRDKGLRALKNFLATAGIPPTDSRQLYSCMQLPVRKTLDKKFRSHGKAYGLTESKMFLQQFIRELGPLGEQYPALFLNELSSLDAVHIISALLSLVPPELSGAQLDSLPQTEDGRRDTDAVHEMERQAMVSNFWRAFDAVLCKEPAQLRDGIVEAVEATKAVVAMARAIRDTKAMHSSRQFHWCKIEQPPHIFRHPSAVRQLAVWLLHVLFAYRPKGFGPERPLLVIVRDRVRDTYLCVGATPARFSEQDEFGNLFRTVLRTDRSLKYRYDFFDKACIEIAADDFDRFWELMSTASI
mmetsp:Transcript_8812/g.16812  ORF Transcript_8812/g.16812 Transcript_8812/m.16812 type:complete len:672 (-) Transcript_8812:97-2112(-)|eukprot:CAMPEP_0172811324 /NCGR_PEP_ID=MMETSP1075-20121228/9339_1 /TAXON_ID=2916 /ORGANISM="Ceratium fusus, Strain PA161109" /LENGTH=671 /DNA_ID=CAMNT_0013650735 /DNA_START=77 /DNA_END=2092 /DNA_ORIENTATION=-